MKNSTALLARVAAGDIADTTIHAALDALREDTAATMLAAILEVAKSFHAGERARELVRATEAIAEGARFRAAIMSRIMQRFRPYYPKGATVIVQEGNSPPQIRWANATDEPGYFGGATALVGARWILTVLDEVTQSADLKRMARRFPRLKN